MADRTNSVSEEELVPEKPFASSLVRRNEGRKILSTFFAINLLLVIVSLVLSCLLLKNTTADNGLLTMFLWLTAILIATASIIFSRIGRPAVSFWITGAGSSLILLLGLISALIGGDKFDTIRAAMLFLIVMLFAYRRKEKAFAGI